MVGLVTDSLAGVPEDIARREDIEIVPVDLIIEGRVYKDLVDIKPKEFYDILRRSKELPKTAAPPPSDFIKAFEKMRRKYDEILCLTVHSSLSGTYSSALKAKEIFGSNIEVIDSGTAVGGQMWMALRIREEAKKGAGVERLKKIADKMREKVNVVVMLETLKYLVKGGRVPKAASLITSILKIKPVLELKGEVKLLSRERTRRRGMERLVKIIEERRDGEKLFLNIMHGDCEEEALRLGEELGRKFPVSELIISYFTPVVGTHTGPGALGFAFYWE